jgi:disulfide bond formation protein DsbB
MKTATQPVYYFIAFFILTVLLAGANYLQIHMGINPCPLCILQRIVFGFLGIVFLFGIAFSFKRCAQLGVGILGLLTAILGAVLSGRQVWLQHLPKNFDANCDVSLSYMLQVLPFHEVMQKVFTGGTACAQVEWEFLHLSLAQWSLGCFILFAVFCLVQIAKK